MKKIIIPIFIVIIGMSSSFTIFLGVIKHIDNKYDNKKDYILAYNDIEKQNNSKNVIEASEEIDENLVIPEETTTTTTPMTTTTITTTKPTEVFEKEINIPKIEDDGSIIYEGLTLTELTDKLNKNLNSTLSNTGIYFANYYVKTGLDPYLALAIVLHETGCKWTCSTLVRECNNIGGMKGTPSCNGGSYMKYDTLEDGINGYLDMLYNNYYSQGLNTPELINPKYAASTTWSEKINNYINSIRAS